VLSRLKAVRQSGLVQYCESDLSKPSASLSPETDLSVGVCGVSYEHDCIPRRELDEFLFGNHQRGRRSSGSGDCSHLGQYYANPRTLPPTCERSCNHCHFDPRAHYEYGCYGSWPDNRRPWSGRDILWLAAGTIAAFTFSMLSTWVLLIEILR